MFSCALGNLQLDCLDYLFVLLFYSSLRNYVMDLSGISHGLVLGSSAQNLSTSVVCCKGRMGYPEWFFAWKINLRDYWSYHQFMSDL